MLEILFILSCLVIGLLDLISFIFSALKYWRISCGFLAASSVIVVICLFTSSPAVRWIVGFHVFVLIVTLAIHWEQKEGNLKD